MMLDHGAVPSELVARFNRMDAPFLLAIRRHMPLVEELLANYDDAGLVALAKQLPFEPANFKVVYPGPTSSARTAFDRWLYRSHRTTDVAAYCALAAQHALSRSLLVIEARQKETRGMVEAINAMVAEVSTSGTPLLAAAVKGIIKDAD